MNKISLKKRMYILRHYFITYELSRIAKRKATKCLAAPFLFIINLKKALKILNNNYLILNYLEMVVTTHCSLRCKDCGNFIQYYKKPYHVSADKNLRAIDRLLDTVDQINQFRILGGEPFLYPDLGLILQRLIQSEKVRQIQIVTNGTIIPQNKELYQIMKDKKISIYISNYGEVSSRLNELDELFKKEKIKFVIAPKDYTWFDLGGAENRNRGIEFYIKQFKRCNPLCKSYLNGKLHHCPRSSNGMDLGLFKPSRHEYVDFLDEKRSVKMLRNELSQFLYGGGEKEMDFITACKYCNKATKYMKKVKPGEQMKKAGI